jgi:hypothetical protein
MNGEGRPPSVVVGFRESPLGLAQVCSPCHENSLKRCDRSEDNRSFDCVVVRFANDNFAQDDRFRDNETALLKPALIRTSTIKIKRPIVIRGLLTGSVGKPCRCESDVHPGARAQRLRSIPT